MSRASCRLRSGRLLVCAPRLGRRRSSYRQRHPAYDRGGGWRRNPLLAGLNGTARLRDSGRELLCEAHGAHVAFAQIQHGADAARAVLRGRTSHPRHVRCRPAWPPGESRLRPPDPLERAPTVRACPAARRRAGRHYERQPRYIRPLGEQPSRKFLSTRGGRRGLWVSPAVWLLGSISEYSAAEPAVAQDRERVCTDLTMTFVRWMAGLR